MRKERAGNRAIKCPECGEANLKVTDSRPVEGSICRRRRRCKSCDYRFTTYEVIEERLFYQGDGAFVLNRASEIQGLLKHLAYVQSRLESLLGEKEKPTDDERIPTPQDDDRSVTDLPGTLPTLRGTSNDSDG